MSWTAPPARPVTLGLLAGGQGTRLGVVDKAWLLRDGESQVVRLIAMFPSVSDVLVSSNSSDPRYASLGLRVVADATPGLGPVAGLAALANACRTPWLLTLPVDTLDPPANLVERLLEAVRSEGIATGAVVQDDEGLQPLAALWATDVLAVHAPTALAAGRLAVHQLVAAAGLRTVRLHGIRLGNLNTLDDLAAARVALPDGGHR